MPKKLTSWWPVLTIIVVELFLFVANYKPGTYLLGWDNVMPEFNLSANLERNLHGVWADYRGLGVLDGLAHTANLVHTVFIGLLSVFLPQSFIRWFFVFFMHVLGGIGMYKLITNFKFLITNKHDRHPELVSGSMQSHGFRVKPGMTMNMLALFGALFYQYNLATVQMFFTPLEVFVIHFAALPWLMLSLITYLEHPTKKHLIGFTLVSLLFTPQAFVPSIWIAYMMLVFAVSLAYWRLSGRKLIRPLGTLAVIIFCINAFWLLPYVYSGIHNAPVIAQTKINIMSNEDIALKQKEFGDFTSGALLHGFSFNQTDYFTKSGRFEYMMEPWLSHIETGLTQIISWILFGLSIVGLLRSFITRDLKLIPFSLVYIVSFSLLATETPIISIIPYVLHTFVPYFSVVFRFAFTKFALIYACVYTILMVYGLSFIISHIRQHIVQKVLIGGTIVLLGIYALPSFTGNFIYSNMKVSLPSDYQELFDYFSTRASDERIAILPAHQYWSWQFYDFGARGSGFLWYGLKQPTMDRAFDPWSRENENFYWELSQAIYAENPELFTSVFKKHQVSWILVDNHIISPENPRSLYADRIQQLISKNPTIVPYKTFGGLELYAVTLPYTKTNHTFVSDAVSIAPSYTWGNIDTGYMQYGMYYENARPSVVIPFQDIFSGRNVSEGNFHIVEDQTSFYITALGSEDLIDNTLVLSSGKKIDSFTDSVAEYTTGTEVAPKIVSREPVSVQIPKITGMASGDFIMSELPTITEASSCDTFRIGKIDRYITPDSAVRFTSLNSSNCYTIDMPQLPHRLGYIIAIEGRFVEGKSMRVGLINTTSGKIDVDVYLPKSTEFVTSYMMVPPMEEYGVGYKLYIDNVSIGADKTINDVKQVRVYPFPYEFISSLSFIKQQGITHTPLLTYSQSYSRQWHAYQTTNWLNRMFPVLLAHELPDHVLVNNWENGWIISKSTDLKNIRIVYLPQYLQYMGFGLLLLGILFLLLYRDNRHVR